MSLTLAYSRASAPVETFGGTTLAVGTWLYSHVPASEPDCGVVVEVIGETGVTMRALDFATGGLRALPRTRAMVRWDGGTAAPRPVEHLTDATLNGYRESNGLTGYFGFLATRFPSDEARAAFVQYRSEAPARRAEEARRIEEAKDKARREIGPWFADLEDALGYRSGNYARVSDVVEAKVIRRALRELVGVKAGVGVRRYSMASGLNFGPPKGHNWTDAEAQAIASVFPSLAWPTTRYDRETGEHRDGWRVDDSCHPSKREDRSDGMADYYDPGGFRVANAYLIQVSAILSEEIEKAARS